MNDATTILNEARRAADYIDTMLYDVPENTIMVRQIDVRLSGEGPRHDEQVATIMAWDNSLTPAQDKQRLVEALALAFEQVAEDKDHDCRVCMYTFGYNGMAETLDFDHFMS